MFKCDQCGKMSKPGEKATLIPETINLERDGKSQTFILKEDRICPRCAGLPKKPHTFRGSVYITTFLHGPKLEEVQGLYGYPHVTKVQCNPVPLMLLHAIERIKAEEADHKKSSKSHR